MRVTPVKTNMTVENPPFEDVFPIENGDFPMLCLFSGVYMVCSLGTHSAEMIIEWIWMYMFV